METGTPRLIYQAARFGKIDELKVLLHEHLPHGRVYQYQDGFQDSHSDISGVSSSDLLEYVDKSSGFTPLIAAIYYHKKTAVELLLDYGADVHNPGLIIRQAPLRVAVCDLNMDSEMVELLVSRGASPFLEDVDGITPLDDVIRLRQNRIGPMPYYLGAVLLSLRRRCPFRGHLELKIERLLGLSQTWRKFFCVVAPRERLPGVATDLQLLIFSKNGFDPITRVWLTNSSYSQIPMKTAHGKLCYQLAMSRKQMKRPIKLYTTGSARTGFSMYIRALAAESSETEWVQRFVTVATTNPALLKSEGSDSHSQNMATGSEEELRTAAARSIAHKQRQQPVNGKLRSMSFSDSAHSSQQRQSPPANKLRTGLSLNSTISRQTVAQYAEALDSPSHTMNGAFRGQDSAYRPADMFHVTQDALASSQPLSFPQHDSGVPLQAAPVLQQAQQPSSGRMEPVAEVNEDGSVHSSHGAELSGPAHQAGAELGGPALQAPPPLVNAPATEQSSLQDGDRTNVINTPWAYGGGERPEWAREQSKSVPFVSADESLKRHWRTIALQGIEDDSASDQSVDLPQQSAARPPQPQWSVPQTGLLPPWGRPYTLPQTHSPASPQPQTPAPPAQDPFTNHLNPSFAGLPTDTSSIISIMEALTLSDPQATVASQQSHQAPNQAKHTDLSKAHIEAASNSMHVPQETTGAFAPQQQAGAFVPQQQAGAFVPQQQAGPAGAEQAGSISPISLVSLSEHTGTHSSPTTAPFQAQSSTSTSQSGQSDMSDLEGLRQRSIALDIPSAELLDSILEFANNVCGPHTDDILASLPLDAHIRNPSLRSLNAYGWQHHAQASHASALQQPHHSAGSYVGQPNASVCEVEPFSDDDDVTVLDTTEIIKQTYPLDMLTQHTNSDHFRTQSVPPPPLQSPSRKPQSPQSPNLQSLHSDGYSLVDSSHLDSASDLVFEITPNSSEYFTPNSSSSSHSPNNSHSPESFAQAQQQQQPVQRIYSVYDSDPQLLSTIPEYEGRSQHLSSGSSHGKHVDGIYATHSSGKSLNIVQPSEFREMVDQLIASGEHQAVQNQAPQHMRSGGAEQLHSSGGMHPIWEDEEDCHMRDMPCRATIGGLATV